MKHKHEKKKTNDKKKLRLKPKLKPKKILKPKANSSQRRKGSKKNPITTGAAKPDWINKRNLFFRPDRSDYVRKLIKDEGCVFCNSAKLPISFDSLCVFKSKHSMIVLNKYPYNSGHLLVLPLNHCGDLLMLNQKVYEDLQKTLRLALKAIQILYKPNGINIGMNLGVNAGAGVPDHLHYHIIPRWLGDLNFFPLIAETKVVIETLETSYEKYNRYFERIKKL